jgi:ABC-type uncharacterized transport system substrate-binding protein
MGSGKPDDRKGHVRFDVAGAGNGFMVELARHRQTKETVTDKVHLRTPRQSSTLQYRFAEQKPERLPALAAELVRFKIDLIVVLGTRAVLAAKHATTTIPIVMALASDPVGAGLVTSLARPGGNVTGLVHARPGAKRKTTGASERDGS